jgi:hypothetical protein
MINNKLWKFDLWFMSLIIILPISAFLIKPVLGVFIIYCYLYFVILLFKIAFGIIYFIKNIISKTNYQGNKSFIIPSVISSIIIFIYNVSILIKDFQKNGSWKPLKYIISDNKIIFISLFIMIGFPFWILTVAKYKEYDEEIIFYLLSIFTPIVLLIDYFLISSLMNYAYFNIFNW